ncbi:MAG: hypothetical protein KDK51_00090 [Deltaproteobacteria bacterium]|nr:hypothetical protein [Deltaproteobacteria bacterium]
MSLLELNAGFSTLHREKNIAFVHQRWFLLTVISFVSFFVILISIVVAVMLNWDRFFASTIVIIFVVGIVVLLTPLRKKMQRKFFTLQHTEIVQKTMKCSDDLLPEMRSDEIVERDVYAVRCSYLRANGTTVMPWQKLVFADPKAVKQYVDQMKWRRMMVWSRNFDSDRCYLVTDHISEDDEQFAYIRGLQLGKDYWYALEYY